MISRFVRFSFTLAEIDRNLHKIMSDEMSALGLRGPQAVYLIRLNMHPAGLTAAELAKLCDRNKADVSRAMAEFEEEGIIYRESGKKPYRSRIRLTEKGILASEKLRERARLAVSLVSKGLSDEKREIFYEALELIASNMQKISEGGLPQA